MNNRLLLLFGLVTSCIAVVVVADRLRSDSTGLRTRADVAEEIYNPLEPEQPLDINEGDLAPVVAPQIISAGYHYPSLNINAEVALEEPGFLVAHDSTINGNVIVASEFIQVPGGEVTIDTQLRLDINDEVFLVLYTDNGDGVFDSSDDMPAVRADGQPASQKLTIVAVE